MATSPAVTCVKSQESSAPGAKRLAIPAGPAASGNARGCGASWAPYEAGGWRGAERGGAGQVRSRFDRGPHPPLVGAPSAPNTAGGDPPF